MTNLQTILKQIPKQSGIYIFRDSDNNIIYIGKARNLFNRVHSYFNKTQDIKTSALVKKIKNLDYFVTTNEVEALLLENNLIKQHLPKYNIKLKDAKSYPFVKITKENIPKILICREKSNNIDEYFGPFINVYRLRTILAVFRKYLKIRTCKKKFQPPYNYTPCLNYHIKRCTAPCAGFISIEDYSQTVSIARNILKGNTKEIIKLLKQKMFEYSEAQNYEKAAELRDQMLSIEDLESQQFVENSKNDDSDYVGIYGDFKMFSISLIKERNGKIIGKENFIITNFLDHSQVLIDFLNVYYLNSTEFPSKIFIPENIEDTKILTEALNKKFNINIKIKVPEMLKDKKILKLSQENAEIYFQEKEYKLDKIHHLRELKKILNLPGLPRNIECFDIATLNGKFNTAAMVSFIDGKPNKTEYRQFNIEGEGHPDDYAMMEEVIARRYQKLKNEKLPLPDLIMVDGGKGQVTSALNSLQILKLDIPIIGLAKKYEHIFTAHSKKPIILSKDSIALKLLQAVRDESHRFSNKRLGIRFKNSTLISKLSEINGVGEKRVNLLIRKFKSIEELKKASIDDIASVDTIGNEIAKNIYDFLKQ